MNVPFFRLECGDHELRYIQEVLASGWLTTGAKSVEFEKKFADGNVPRPDHWGGYRLVPNKFEFWQGRSNRLHDRLLYKMKQDTWTRVRLAP